MPQIEKPKLHANVPLLGAAVLLSSLRKNGRACRLDDEPTLWPRPQKASAERPCRDHGRIRFFLSASQQSIIEKYDNITSGSGAIVMSHNAGCAATGCRMAGVRAAKHVQPKVNPHQVNDGFHMGPANILSGLWASFGNRSATQSLGQLIKSHPEMVSIDHEQQLTATIPWWEWNAHFEVVELPNPLHAGEKMVKQRVRNRRTGTMPSFFHLPEATEKMRQNPEKQAIWTVHFDQLVGIAVPVAAHRRRRTVVGWPFEICKFKTEGPCRHPPSELCCGFDRDKPGESCPNGFRKFIV